MGCVLGVFVVCLFYIVVSWWGFFEGWVGGGGVGKQFANVLWWLWGYALPVETTS